MHTHTLAPSTSAVTVRRDYKRAAFASTVGTTVEWYDFFIYAQAAALIFADLFFAPMGGAGQLVAYVTVGISFVFRPLGAVLAGYFGDLIGRKAVLVATLAMMGIATVGIGLLPTYASIGVWAPIALIVLRIVQGFSTGGEWGGAALMSVEHAPPTRRGIFGASTQMGVPLGMLLATATLTLCTVTTTDEQFREWGWRLPFLVSILLIVIGFYIRRRVEESPVFVELSERKQRSHAPVRALLRRHPRQVILAALSFIGTNGNGYMVIGGFLVAYASKTFGLGRTELLIATLASAVVWGAFTLIGAAWSDTAGRTRVMNVGNALLALFAVPFFFMVDTGSLAWIYVALIVFAVGLGLSYGPQPALFAEMFPAAVRYSGASIAYAIGAILGGAFVPTVSQWLLTWTGTTTAIGIYLGVLAVISFAATRAIKDRSGVDLSL
ncbi:MFS transporter [Rhodococcus chondri]|uniref:MFS transporter n=1 Tax=Rhodococcus chondri TaxID=3065941 RepID=A0ABU7JMU1_9NOCA|nr:MFS transporter [Rhodococcus sp. CC-R104]MEE2030642.1 MFS transporter [Rhodococcus sp. CC-R104]